MVEGQERNMTQLERIGAQKERARRRRMKMKRRGSRMALEKIRERGLYCPPPVS